jgi:hypothetical protein
MAKKNRRRGKKKKQNIDEQYFDDEENIPLAKGEDIISDHVLHLLKILNIPIKRKLFKPFGFECVECEWITNKNNVPGRNAMRAHQKKHKNERRAQNHMLLLVWGGVILVFVIIVVAVTTRIEHIPVRISTLWLTPSTITGLVLAGASVLIAMVLIAFTQLHNLGQARIWRVGYFTAIGLGGLLLVVEALLASGLTEVDVAVPWLVSGLLPVVALAVARTEFANTKLLRSRRELKSPRYIRRYKAITADGDMEYMELQAEIGSVIRKRGLERKSFRPSQQKVLREMDVTLYKLRPKPTSRRDSKR